MYINKEGRNLFVLLNRPPVTIIKTICKQFTKCSDMKLSRLIRRNKSKEALATLNFLQVMAKKLNKSLFQ